MGFFSSGKHIGKFKHNKSAGDSDGTERVQLEKGPRGDHQHHVAAFDGQIGQVAYAQSNI